VLGFIDDATGRLMHLQFVESESTFAYFDAARAYLEAWGKPVGFYSDKHGVFSVNHPRALGGDDMTQFGRALHALNIDVICANSSQAKGRVERAHKTLQGWRQLSGRPAMAIPAVTASVRPSIGKARCAPRWERRNGACSTLKSMARADDEVSVPSCCHGT
jgi:hypothetical protein